jgi:hypothetical protein
LPLTGQDATSEPRAQKIIRAAVGEVRQCVAEQAGAGRLIRRS